MYIVVHIPEECESTFSFTHTNINIIRGGPKTKQPSFAISRSTCKFHGKLDIGLRQPVHAIMLKIFSLSTPTEALLEIFRAQVFNRGS